MRKNYFITVLLSATLLISGCSNVNVPQTVSEDETKETLKRLHYDGYNLIKKFSRTLFANKIFE